MKIQWEYDLAECAFCRQLAAMGWQWIQGDTDIPDFTERPNFREVFLKGRLVAALKKLNSRDGQPWLDQTRIARAIRDLEQSAGHRLMETNQSATERLLKGTVAEGLPDWEQGRPQPIRYIDFENPENNDFLVINQFKVELTSGRGHVIPDGGGRKADTKIALGVKIGRPSEIQQPQRGAAGHQRLLKRLVESLPLLHGLRHLARGQRLQLGDAVQGGDDVAFPHVIAVRERQPGCLFFQ